MEVKGIVRRIDDLGRVALPKEMRRTMRLKEGTPLEIAYTGDSIIITKHIEATMADMASDMKDRLDEGYDKLDTNKVKAIRKHLLEIQELLSPERR
jgi:looped-hinge helix DNA binding domain, AbrB family